MIQWPQNRQYNINIAIAKRNDKVVYILKNKIEIEIKAKAEAEAKSNKCG